MATSEKLSDWLQIIGTFGLIASIVFVGLQMRQTHEIAMSSIYQSRTDRAVETGMTIAASPELLSATAKVYAGKADELSMIETFAYEAYVV